jgi:two-component system chemotaxis response regulator CheB
MSDQTCEHKEEHEPDGDAGRIGVLIVDDSALMRRLLSDLLGSAPEIKVVGTARDGREALVETIRLKPDVITLDVEMPEVSGLEALPALLAAHDAPVVMISALTQEGAEVTLQALELGAFDFLPKPQRNQLAELRASRDLLVAKVLAAAQSRVGRSRRRAGPRRTKPPASVSTSISHIGPAKYGVKPGLPPAAAREWAQAHGAQCFVIGISTGGPQALAEVFPQLAPPLPPILVVQHMPPAYTRIFAQRLDRYSPLTVKQAEEGDLVLPDRVFIAPGGLHMTLVGHPPRVQIALSDLPPVSGHRPSIDVLFRCAAKAYQAAVVSLLMTGMGRDGVDGCKAILAAGGLTLGQDEATSAVYGMNKAAFQEGAVKAQFSLEDLPGIIQNIAAFRSALESGSCSD